MNLINHVKILILSDLKISQTDHLVEVNTLVLIREC